jgi:hypothetical protein
VESVAVEDAAIAATPTSLRVVTRHARHVDVVPFPEHEQIAFAVLVPILRISIFA